MGVENHCLGQFVGKVVKNVVSGKARRDLRGPYHLTITFEDGDYVSVVTDRLVLVVNGVSMETYAPIVDHSQQEPECALSRTILGS